jgi:F-type H+-transporting ATPase subunit epsilon
MEEKILHLEIITPEQIKFKDKIKVLVAPGALGSLGILPDHAPLLTILETGEVKIRLLDNTELYFIIGGGLLEVNSNNLTLLADSAQKPDEINISDEKSLLEKLQNSLSACADMEERERMLKDIKFCTDRLNFGTKFQPK